MSNATERAIGARVAYPLFQTGDGGSTPTIALRARDLAFEPCAKSHAVALVRAWHSRLPNCQRGPWMYAYHAHHDGVTYAVALWNSPSARTLPGDWIELRRMACAPDAPKNTASRFMGWMVKHLRAHHPQHPRAISYQDTEVHTGTIYRASGWTLDHVSAPRVRDRSGHRVGTTRQYRSNLNGLAPDASAKARWSVALTSSAERAA